MADVEIKLRSSQERLESLNSGVYRRATIGEYNSVCKALAHFMIAEDGRYLGEAAGLGVIDSMSIKEVKDTFVQLSAVIQDSAVPKATG